MKWKGRRQSTNVEDRRTGVNDIIVKDPSGAKTYIRKSARSTSGIDANYARGVKKRIKRGMSKTDAQVASARRQAAIAKRKATNGR